MSSSQHKILMVDDEVNILKAYRRSIGRKFQVTTAASGAEGLEKIDDEGPFAAVVTDMQMPEMNGVAFLMEAQKLAPETVYLMLTGNADQQTAIDAVNQGKIFRFLNKPCDLDTLGDALQDAIRQYELITAEKELLRGTLMGSVRLMMDTVSLSNPDQAPRFERVQKIAHHIIQRAKPASPWQHELAASLCLVGLVAVPAQAPESVISEADLEQCAKVGARLVKHIPRMNGVAKMIQRQREPCYDIAQTDLTHKQHAVAVGAQILRLSIDLEQKTREGFSIADAIEAFREHPAPYDPRLLDIAATLCLDPNNKMVRTIVGIAELRQGMVLDEPLETDGGTLLLATGLEVSQTAVERVQHHLCIESLSRDRKLRVFVPAVKQAA